MTTAYAPRPNGAVLDGPPSSGPPEDERQALALSREFGAPAGILDREARAWSARHGPAVERFPEADSCLDALGRLAEVDRGMAAVWQPGDPAEPTWLVLPIDDDSPPGRLAMLGFGRGVPADPGAGWGPPCPEPALRLWGQAILDARRLGRSRREGSRPSAARRGRPPSLTERLIRRLRVSDAPERFQRMTVATVRDELEARAVAWVPAQGIEPVAIAQGESSLSPETFRALAAREVADPLRLSGGPEGIRATDQVVVVAADAESTRGWLVVVEPANNSRVPGPAVAEVLQPVASLIATQRANARLYGDLKDLIFGVIRALTSAIDAKDPYTSGHSERVARIAVRLGEQLGMNANERGDLYLMGLLHDVGKIGIDDQILKKPGKLTPEEYRLIQSHVRIGVHILTDLKKLQHLMPGVAHHHESYDGSGYPAGLAGEEIPLAARILAVADAYDAMSSTRPYRRRLGPDQIDAIFRDGAGSQWDPRVVDALFAGRGDVERIRQKGLGESLNRAVDDTIGRG